MTVVAKPLTFPALHFHMKLKFATLSKYFRWRFNFARSISREIIFGFQTFGAIFYDALTVVPRNDLYSEWAGLVNRTCQPNSDEDDNGTFKTCVSWCRAFDHPLVELLRKAVRYNWHKNYSAWLKHQTPNVRARLAKPRDRLSSKYPHLTSFPKIEKFVACTDVPFVVKNARIVTSQSDRENADWAPYSFSLSKLIYPVISRWSNNCMIACGMNTREVGEWIHHATDWGFCYYISSDCTSFDGSVPIAGKLMEQWLYGYLGLKSANAWTALHAQLHKHVKSRHGISYQCLGRTTSGSPNTSMGNSLLRLFATMDVLKRMHCKEYRLIVLGDDQLVCLKHPMTPDELKRFDSLQSDFGFIQVSTVAHHPANIDFLSSHPLPTLDGTWAMTPKIGKFAPKIFCSTKFYKPLDLAIHRAQVCKASLKVAGHNPVLRAILEDHLRFSPDIPDEPVYNPYVDDYRDTPLNPYALLGTDIPLAPAPFAWDWLRERYGVDAVQRLRHLADIRLTDCYSIYPSGILKGVTERDL